VFHEGIQGNLEGESSNLSDITEGLFPGTTTNLFLFIAEENLKEQVDKSFNLPPTYETLVSRAQLASVSCSDL